MSFVGIKKLELTGIRNIIFDLGNVILNLDFDATITAFKDLGMDEEVISWDQAYADPVFYDLEVGRVSPDDFRSRVRQILGNKELTDEMIDEAWSAMILDVPPYKIQLLQELKKRYKVFLFSNTNFIHINRLQKQFKAEHGIEFSTLFDKVYYSHEIHERKPDLTSYRKVLGLENLDPSETLFIDDLEKNIHGAKNAGIKTFWLKSGIDLADLF
ncbi:MAG TPA: HAD family phosphatase [Mariniphaga sp.]|nr:HAD family phosphatase [Mariniphaga sp.]